MFGLFCFLQALKFTLHRTNQTRLERVTNVRVSVSGQVPKKSNSVSGVSLRGERKRLQLVQRRKLYFPACTGAVAPPLRPRPRCMAGGVVSAGPTLPTRGKRLDWLLFPIIGQHCWLSFCSVSGVGEEGLVCVLHF